MEYLRDTVVLGSDTTVSVLEDEMRRIGWTSTMRRVNDIEEAFRALDDDSGVAFLIELSEMTGNDDRFSLLRRVKRLHNGTRRTAVVIIGNRPADAIRAFELDAFDCLMTPLDRNRVAKSLKRLRDHIDSDHLEAFSHRLQTIIDSVIHGEGEHGGRRKRTARRPVERLGVRVGDRWIMLRVEDIQSVSGAGVYVSICAGGQTYLLRATLAEIEVKLDPDRFLRIHRSTIVNMDMVREIRQHGKGAYDVVLSDGTQLKVSRRYGDRVREFMGAVG